MKAKISTTLTALAVILSCSITSILTISCSDGDSITDNDITYEATVWDISPLVISVKVVSTEGYSVLNEQTVKKITAT